MRDEIDGRLWDAHGRELSDGLHHLFLAAAGIFARLLRSGRTGLAHPATTATKRAGQA